MPQPFGIGDVVGGRYRVTHHVVTSADQDIVFQATDEVLGRRVSVLLSSRANAKQVATSAKELAAGSRDSAVEVLDLGLTEGRTFLISTVVDPNQLLDLVVPDSAPYVEPYYTDSLGSELFGQSREIAPHTYDDDAEYYARLHSGRPGRDPHSQRRARRPGFLDKVTPGHRVRPRIDQPAYSQQELESELESAGQAHGLTISQEIARVSFSLHSDLQLTDADPRADSGDDHIEAVMAVPEAKGAAKEAVAAQPVFEAAPSSAVPVVSAAALQKPGPSAENEELLAEGEEVVDDPPAEPDASYDVHQGLDVWSESDSEREMAAESSHRAVNRNAHSGQDRSTFTGLISAVPSQQPNAFPAQHQSEAPSDSGRQQDSEGRISLNRWIPLAILIILLVAAAIIVFIALTG